MKVGKVSVELDVELSEPGDKIILLNIFYCGYELSKDSGLHMLKKSRWLGEIILDPISKDFFKTDRGYYVKFIRDKNNKIAGLSVNSGRTLHVIFNRK